MTTLVVASGMLGPQSSLFDSNDFLYETLDPTKVKKAIRRAHLVPTRIGRADDPNELLARLLIQQQEQSVQPNEESQDWFTQAIEIYVKYGKLGKLMATGLMAIARGSVKMLIGISRMLIRSMVRVIWGGISLVVRTLAPILLRFPWVAAIVAASAAGYLAYKYLNEDAGKERRRGPSFDDSFSDMVGGYSYGGSSTGVGDRTGADYSGGVSRAGVRKAPKLPDDVAALAEETAGRYSLNPAEFKAFIAIESGGRNVSRGEHGAKGLLQFVPGTARAYGIEGREMDMAANLDAGARLYLDNARYLKSRGIAPTATNIYLAHQQGMGSVPIILDAAKEGKRIDQLPNTQRKNVRNNLFGNSTYVSEYVASTRDLINQYVASYSNTVSDTNSIPPVADNADTAVQEAVDSQMKKPEPPEQVVASAASPNLQTEAPDLVLLPGTNTLVDASM